MRAELTIVKIGGNVLDMPETLEAFLMAFAGIPGLKILVHGGGKMATRWSRKLGVEPQMIDGRRVTTDEGLDIITMVYGGLVNKQITASLQAQGCKAIGMSGADAGIITAEKRPVKPMDFGWVGDITQVERATLSGFFEMGLTPVLCPITHDGKGQLLNTNADTIAAEVAVAMAEEYEVKLVYCFEKQGVLANMNDENSVIPELDIKLYEEMKTKGSIHDGMLPKLHNCFYSLRGGVASVIIGSPEVINNHSDLHTKITL